MKAALSFLAILLSACVLAADNESKHCFVPSWDGLVPGVSCKRNVTSLYGAGYYRDELGDTGLLAYLSKDGKSTFIFIFGMGERISSITILRGAGVTKGMAPVDLKQLPKKIPVNDEWPVSLLGKSREAVIGDMGKPDSSLTTQEALWYPNPVTGPSVGSLVFHIRAGIVVEIELIGDIGC